MKTIPLLLLCAFTLPAAADQFVQGHVRSDGTYVAPHFRSDANDTRSDNWSTTGNSNPYTHQQGTRRDTTYPTPPSPYSPGSSAPSPYRR